MAGLSAGWVVPGRGMGAVDEDEVSLLDRFGESAREEEQDCFEEDGDTSPGFWRSWAGRLPGGRRPLLGQVLAKDQQAGHHLVLQGDAACG